jgi:ATP-GRASP peptide maturase of grasp-with-spasm system
MILIVSTNNYELSTERVMDWLYQFNIPVQRINGDDFNKENRIFITIDDVKQIIEFDKTTIQKSYSSAWFRRWGSLDNTWFFENKKISFNHFNEISSALRWENSTLKEYFLNSLKVDQWLTNPEQASLNKLEVLQEALKCQIDVPSTLITNKKKDLKKFLFKHKKIITKALGEAIGLSTKNANYSFFTYQLTQEILDEIPSEFPVTLFQEMIEKEFEIRSFYLNGIFYSMAIFSQNDNQTEVDFRNYIEEKPNRNVPYILPDLIQEKLASLMKKFNLNTGSIDIIKSKQGKYIFLEINPIGQFGMVSRPCNYPIEKEIAKFLINNDKNEK